MLALARVPSCGPSHVARRSRRLGARPERGLPIALEFAERCLRLLRSDFLLAFFLLRCWSVDPGAEVSKPEWVGGGALRSCLRLRMDRTATEVSGYGSFDVILGSTWGLFCYP